MEKKNFLGLDGLKHFWTKAKTWIIDRITTEVTAKIAEVVAKAPEDLDTLKEIADWIKNHANDASAMNTQINTNKNDIAALQTSVAGKAAASHTHDDRYFTETEVTNKLAGKSDTWHTHTKSQITDFPTSLPANGGTATKANNGFNSSTTTDSTPGWGYLTSGNGYSNGRTYGFANGGGIATAEKDTKSSLQVDGDLYVHEGLDKVATLNDIPTSLPANGGTATKATQDGNGNVITSTYVKKSGDTLTGPIVMKANQYTLDTAQLDMKNSDIKGANAIWFNDHAEVGEGLKFPRSSGSNYDFMRLDDGKIKVASNVAGNTNTATESIVAYTSDIPTSLPANGGTATNATNLKVSNHDANNAAYYPIWANGKGNGSTARGIYTSTDLNYIPATGNFKSKQFTVGGEVSLQWNSTTKSLDFTFA